MINIKKILLKTFLNDFVVLWNAPIDTPAFQSIKEESAKTGFEKAFKSHIFGNIILGKKS